MKRSGALALRMPPLEQLRRPRAPDPEEREEMRASPSRQAPAATLERLATRARAARREAAGTAVWAAIPEATTRERAVLLEPAAKRGQEAARARSATPGCRVTGRRRRPPSGRMP